MGDKSEEKFKNQEEFDFGKKKKKKMTKNFEYEETLKSTNHMNISTFGATQNNSSDIYLKQESVETDAEADQQNLSIINLGNSLDIQAVSGSIEDFQTDRITSEHDYTYEEILERMFNIIKVKNPDMVEKKRFTVIPPLVGRVGTKRTSFTNFGEICSLLKREENHLLNYILAELGTSGSIDKNKQLIVRGIFAQKHFENLLRRYIKEYIKCHSCDSADTQLLKNERIVFLQCKTCQSKAPVGSIKSGFRAQVVKRSRQRAKDN